MNRAEQAQLTKDQLFNTSVRLFKEHGYANTTVSSICKEAGVAKGTFYVHYKSKDSIVKESYYLNLTQFMEKNFVYDSNTKDKHIVIESVITFLNLELKFAELMGIELTTLAFTFNLGGSLSGENSHFLNRPFSKALSNLIAQLDPVKDKNYLFTTFESLIRGIMATWCFSGGKFDILGEGGQMIQDMVYCYLK